MSHLRYLETEAVVPKIKWLSFHPGNKIHIFITMFLLSIKNMLCTQQLA